MLDGMGKDAITSYRVSIVSDETSWINEFTPELKEALLAQGHEVCEVHRVSEIPEGDFAFFLGCGQIVSPPILERNCHNLVVHESDLPRGRGWSPLTWQILEGKNEIPIVLFEAQPAVDSGKIYLRDVLHFKGFELVEDLRRAQAAASIRMCLEFVRRYPAIVAEGHVQEGEATYFPRRGTEDSRLDVEKPLRDLFPLLRVADNKRYPAFFELNGYRYVLAVQRVDAPTEDFDIPEGR